MSLGDDEGGATCARCKGPMSIWDKRWATNGAHPDAWRCVLGLEKQVAELQGEVNNAIDYSMTDQELRLRIQELEQRCSDMSNAEHMPTSGDLL